MFFKKKEIQAVEKSVFDKLKFRQEDCLHINESKETVNFEAKNFNDRIFISSYKQTDINAGILLGMPSDLSPYFEDSIKEAETFFKSECYFIKPVIFQQTDEENIKSFLLPSVFTMATFEKANPLEEDKDSEDYASTIKIAWWQNAFGSPSAEIYKELETIVWKSLYAYSWSH